MGGVSINAYFVVTLYKKEQMLMHWEENYCQLLYTGQRGKVM